MQSAADTSILQRLATQTIVIRNAAKDESGALKDLVFQRESPAYHDWQSHTKEGPRLRQSGSKELDASTTIPSGDDYCYLNIRDSVGSGTVGRVFDVDITRSNGEALSTSDFPPIVAKVSICADLSELEDADEDFDVSSRHSDAGEGHVSTFSVFSNEAFFYEKLQSIQGVLIARYFGFYSTVLPAHWRFTPWIVQMSVPRLSGLAPGQSPQYEKIEWCRSYERPVQASFILLEKLGDLIGPSNPKDDAYNQVVGAFEEIVDLGVRHGDVRSENVVAEPQFSGALPGLHSPHTGRRYDYRIIDLHLASHCPPEEAQYEVWDIESHCDNDDILGRWKDQSNDPEGF